MSNNAPLSDFSKSQRPDEEWLEKALPEEPIRSEVPIIDTHMHLWHHPTGYRYFAEDHAKDIASSKRNVAATVFVECGSFYRANGPSDLRSVGETQFAAGQAAISESGKYGSASIAAGLVANVDLLSAPDRLEAILDIHESVANGRLRGIRRPAKWDADPVIASGKIADRPGILTEPELHRGLRQVAARGLIYEATVFHPQIADVAALASNVGDATIVLDHCGSPLGYAGYRGQEDEVYQDWQAAMRVLASCPNVTVKLGGLLMSLANYDFKAAERPIHSAQLADLWRPIIEPCIELFGPDRCMVASNFPVEKAGITYATAMNTFMRLFAGCTEDSLNMLCHGTASRVYRIPVRQPLAS